MANKFKLIERKNDCVLLVKIEGNRAKYVVKDIENDIIHINYDNLAMAKKCFNEYDIEAIHKAKQDVFEDWLKEFVEA